MTYLAATVLIATNVSRGVYKYLYRLPSLIEEDSETGSATWMADANVAVDPSNGGHMQSSGRLSWQATKLLGERVDSSLRARNLCHSAL